MFCIKPETRKKRKTITFRTARMLNQGRGAEIEIEGTWTPPSNPSPICAYGFWCSIGRGIYDAFFGISLSRFLWQDAKMLSERVIESFFRQLGKSRVRRLNGRSYSSYNYIFDYTERRYYFAGRLTYAICKSNWRLPMVGKGFDADLTESA